MSQQTPSCKATFEAAVERSSMRVRSDRTLTKDGVNFAANSVWKELLADRLPIDSLSIMRRLTHLAQQASAIEFAAREITAELTARNDDRSRARLDGLQTAAAELFNRIAERTAWVCDDRGHPTVDAARADLWKRMDRRTVAEIRRGEKVGDEATQEAIGRVAVDVAFDDALQDRLFLEYVESHLCQEDRAKWWRFLLVYVHGLDQRTVGELFGKSHAAARTELGRFCVPLRPLLQEWLDFGPSTTVL